MTNTRCRFLFAALGLALPPSLGAAEPTRELRYGDPKEMFEGDPVSAALTARGTVVAGSAFEEVVAGSGPVTALALGGDGRLYVGTVDGLFQLQDRELVPIEAGVEGTVTSLLATEEGVLAGFSPKGRVVALAKGQASDSFEVGAEYIWDLAARGDRLWIATGVPGRLLRRHGDEIETVWSSGEAHLRSIAISSEAEWFCTGEKGIVFERRDGRIRALYDSDLEECTGLALGPEGEVFASLVSTKRKPGTAPFVYIPAVGDDEEDVESPFKGSELVRVDPDGSVRLLWRSQREGALDLMVLGSELVMGTATGPGAKGRVYALRFGGGDLRLDGRVDAASVSTLLAETSGAFSLGDRAGGGPDSTLGGAARPLGLSIDRTRLSAGRPRRSGVVRRRAAGGDSGAGADPDRQHRGGRRDLVWLVQALRPSAGLRSRCTQGPLRPVRSEPEVEAGTNAGASLHARVGGAPERTSSSLRALRARCGRGARAAPAERRT